MDGSAHTYGQAGQSRYNQDSRDLSNSRNIGGSHLSAAETYQQQMHFGQQPHFPSSNFSNPSQQQSGVGSDYDYMKNGFGDINISSGQQQAPSGSLAGHSTSPSIDQNRKISHQGGQSIQPITLPGGMAYPGSLLPSNGDRASQSSGALQQQQQMQGLMGMNPQDYGMYVAQLAAASQQAGMTSPLLSGNPFGQMNGANAMSGQHQRGASSMLPGQSSMANDSQGYPNSPNFGQNMQQFGLVGPASYAAAAMLAAQQQQQQQQQQSTSTPNSAQNSPFPFAGAMGAGPPNPGSISTSPAAQAMSAMSSFSGAGSGIPSSNTSVAPGSATISPLSPATGFTPNFASPSLAQNAAFQAAAAAAGLGLGGPGGLYNLNMTGLGLGVNPAAMAAAAAAAGMPNQGLGNMGLPSGMDSPNLQAQFNEMAAHAAQNNPVIRTVYVGNLPGDASVDELLSLVRYGPIENVKILPDKSCAFISFLDPSVASAFQSDATLRKIRLHGQELKIGWGKPTTIPAPVVQAVQQHGATRNVYLGNLDENFTEQSLRDDLSRYGHIDQVKIVRDKNIGFVHFLSIATAIKVVTELPKEPEWAGRRVNYGKDRCAYVPRNQHQQQQHNQMAAAMAAQAASQVMSPFNPMSPAMPMSPLMSPMAFQGGFVDPSIQIGNRTIYLGNLHPDTTCEDVCNTIRGGILQEVRLLPEKHICFVSFVLPESALALYQYAISQGITVKNRRLKIGWGKNSGPCPPGISAIVAAGGSRNVYIGNIDDFEVFTLEKIKEDLGQYGDIEQVNALEDKSCAFVNFTKISTAVKAIEALKQHEEYSKFKIAYGKDRVGNVARGPMLRRGPGGRHDGQQGISSPAFDGFNSPSFGPNLSPEDIMAFANSGTPRFPMSPRHEQAFPSAPSAQAEAVAQAGTAVTISERQQDQQMQ